MNASRTPSTSSDTTTAVMPAQSKSLTLLQYLMVVGGFGLIAAVLLNLYY